VIGPPDEAVRGGRSRVRRERDAHARPQLQPARIGPRELLGDPLAEVLGCLDVADVLGEDRELVTAVARDRVGRPHQCAQAGARFHEHVVARLVPVHVVHLLEPVEVDEEHGDGDGAPTRAGECLLEAVVEEVPVRQPGQRVVEGTMGERGGVLAQPVQVDEDGQLRPQHGRVERLHDVVDGPGRIGLQAALGRVLPGDEDDRHVAGLLPAPDRGGRLEPVHARQADIEQDRGDVRLMQQVAQGLLPGTQGRQLGVERFDHGADRLEGGRAVVDG